ncbi:MAG: hypothetical protein RSA78_03350 [Oscillospiraceae bacterium]
MESAIEEATLESAMEEATLESAIEEATLESAIEDATLESAIEEATLESAIDVLAEALVEFTALAGLSVPQDVMATAKAKTIDTKVIFFIIYNLLFLVHVFVQR